MRAQERLAAQRVADGEQRSSCTTDSPGAGAGVEQRRGLPPRRPPMARRQELRGADHEGEREQAGGHGVTGSTRATSAPISSAAPGSEASRLRGA